MAEITLYNMIAKDDCPKIVTELAKAENQTFISIYTPELQNRGMAVKEINVIVADIIEVKIRSDQNRNAFYEVISSEVEKKRLVLLQGQCISYSEEEANQIFAVSQELEDLLDTKHEKSRSKRAVPLAVFLVPLATFIWEIFKEKAVEFAKGLVKQTFNKENMKNLISSLISSTIYDAGKGLITADENEEMKTQIKEIRAIVQRKFCPVVKDFHTKEGFKRWYGNRPELRSEYKDCFHNLKITHEVIRNVLEAFGHIESFSLLEGQSNDLEVQLGSGNFWESMQALWRVINENQQIIYFDLLTLVTQINQK